MYDNIKAYNCLEDLRNHVPKVNPSEYVDRRILEAVYRAVNVPFKDGAMIVTGSKNGFKSHVTGSDDEEGEVLDEEVVD